MNDPGPTSHFFVSQRLRLHYVDWGNPDKPLLLLVHGGRDHCRNWDATALALRDDWHVVAPDLRGHGDSAWSPDGNYDMLSFVYDLAQLIEHLGAPTVTIVAHSLGGNIALRYTGLFPDRVEKLIAIEGLGPSPTVIAEQAATPPADHLRKWIADKHSAAGRMPKRYASFDDALARMRAENGHLSEAQAHHLTLHGKLELEVRQLSQRLASSRHIARRNCRAVGRNYLPDPAILRGKQLGLQSRTRRSAGAFQDGARR